MTLSWQNLAVQAPLLALVGYAAFTDLRARRIPNWVTLALALSGVAQSLTPWGLITLKQSLLGLACGFAITFVLYIIGGRGAGDVKLTAGIGAWLGAWPVIGVLAVAAVVSLISSLVHSFLQGKLLALFRSAGLMLLMLLSARGRRVGAGAGAGAGASAGEVGGSTSLLQELRNWPSIGRPLPNGVSTLVGTVLVIVWIGLR